MKRRREEEEEEEDNSIDDGDDNASLTHDVDEMAKMPKINQVSR